MTSHKIDLRPALSTTYASWEEQRAALVRLIESTSWYASVVQAVGPSFPYDPDSEFPGEAELCATAHCLELLGIAPDLADAHEVLALLGQLWSYDDVTVIMPKQRRHLVALH